VQDFSGLSPTAVAQALSRLSRQGEITRLGKGLYYRSRETLFGSSSPNPALLRRLAAERGPLFPSGLAAANLLGFTTQNPAQVELATSRLSLPRLLVGRETKVHTRRPAAWSRLSETDAALLDFLRHRGETSELSSQKTIARLLKLCSGKGRFERLLRVAGTEPPRVRALLGAIGQQLGSAPQGLGKLRRSLNPLSRFDFGILSALEFASQWQGGKRSSHAAR
jgi:hypothetical protein